VIKCYQSLSLAISKALLVEETNSQYLTYQSKILHDSIDQQTIDDNNSCFLDKLAFYEFYK
jgi:hypothetical protein